MSSKGKRKAFAVNGLFVVYLMVLLRITVFRPGISLGNRMKNGSLNLIPLKDLLSIPQKAGWLRFFYLFAGNMVWFVPFGAWLANRFPGLSVKKVCIYGFLLSLTIECSQYVFGTGVSEVDDLILNTAGTWIGWYGIKKLK